MAEDRWSTLTRAVSKAIAEHDNDARRVDQYEAMLVSVEEELAESAEALRAAVAALHAEFPELTPGHV